MRHHIPPQEWFDTKRTEAHNGRPGGLPVQAPSPKGLGHSAGIPDADDYDDWHDEGCYECGGEGFISDCVEEWACVDPEYSCDYCTRRCPLCNPAKPNDKEGGQYGNDI